MASLILGLFISFTSFAETIMVINPIEVPKGKEKQALEIWDTYANYFRVQPGYLGTKLHKALDSKAKFHYINIAEWKSAEDFLTALNSEKLKKLGKGFPEDMPHYPSIYTIVRE